MGAEARAWRGVLGRNSGKNLVGEFSKTLIGFFTKLNTPEFSKSLAYLFLNSPIIIKRYDF